MVSGLKHNTEKVQRQSFEKDFSVKIIFIHEPRNRLHYKIIDEVRKYDVRVRYFSYASAKKCAEQIVADEKAMNK